MKTFASFDLIGRAAVVTGGNGGIGRGIALGLAQAGAAVAIFGRNQEKNQQVFAELQSIGVPAIAVAIDLTLRAGLEPALKRVENELGSVDILVNNAGTVSLSGGVMNEKAEDWDGVIETQLNSVFLLSTLIANHQHRQHVLVLWIRPHPLVQRGEGRDCATDQVDGHRIRAAQYSSECNCTRVD
jgi:2-deoxy-D-gluconate 3-dehydrogenase